MTTKRSLSLRRPGIPAPDYVSRDQVLAVGLTEQQSQSLPQRLFGALADSTRSIEIDMLDKAALAKSMVVLSPIFGATFDAVDLAERLHSHGYTGRYIAVVSHLPDYSVIMEEVGIVAPDLSFDIVETGHGPRNA